jgi:hypothetical protein
MGDDALVMGAVAYYPKVVTIWDGFRAWLRDHDLPFDYVLYSNYERQVEDLVAGRIHAAWNSPLAWVRSRRLAGAAGVKVAAIAMRDTDRISRHRRHPRRWREARTRICGRVVGVGAVDSPQARSSRSPTPRRGSAWRRLPVRRFDVGGAARNHVGGGAKPPGR